MEARPCSCCNTDIPSAQGPPGTVGWTLTTVHICCSMPISPWQRYAMGFVEWHEWPAEGAVLLAYVESSSRWLRDFFSEISSFLRCGWRTREEGDALALLCDGSCEPTSPAAAWGHTGRPAWGLLWEPPHPPAQWGLQRHLSAILRPGCLAQAVGRGASCLFQLFWHFRNAHPSLKLHFKVFNPSVGCIPHA